MSKPFCVHTIAIAVALLSSPLARAAFVAFDFTGKVTQVDPALAGSIAVGNAVSGKYVFDTNSPDISADPTAGVYPMTGLYHTVTVGGFSYTGTDMDFNVFNELDLSGSGFFRDQYRAALHVTSPSFTVNGYPYKDFTLDLFTTTSTPPSGSPITSDALPAIPPPVNQFDNRLITLFFYVPLSNGGLDIRYVYSTVDSLTLGLLPSATVPEPRAALILMAAVFAWVTIRGHRC